MQDLARSRWGTGMKWHHQHNPVAEDKSASKRYPAADGSAVPIHLTNFGASCRFGRGLALSLWLITRVAPASCQRAADDDRRSFPVRLVLPRAQFTVVPNFPAWTLCAGG